jgi:hypothetical protein
MVLAGHPIEFFEMTNGGGKLPSLTLRHIVVRLRPVRAITSGGRSI